MDNSQYKALIDLPLAVPVFPLSGAILFPRWGLPLNIFEPRYLNMIDDAMATHRLIGMVQTMDDNRANPALASVGCLGEITSHSETNDGRYLVNLSGVIRFEIAQELDEPKPYRQARPRYEPFAGDLHTPAAFASPSHQMVINALKPYAAANGLETDWDVIADADMEVLINALSAGCPFDPMEKQALLEAENLEVRAETLIQIMQMNTAHNHDDGGASLQ